MGGFMNSLTEVFLKVLDMSMAATWMMLAVALLRALLKKAPRSLICLMWALTAVRLLCRSHSGAFSALCQASARPIG